MRTVLFLFALVSCSQSLPVYVKRVPAQSEYTACHEIKSELLEPRVDVSRLEKNYANVKNVVFKNNCAACHFGVDSYRPHLDDYTETLEYINLQEPLKSKLWTTLVEGRMPPSYRLGSREPEAQAFLRAWLEAGAPRD